MEFPNRLWPNDVAILGHPSTILFCISGEPALVGDTACGTLPENQTLFTMVELLMDTFGPALTPALPTTLFAMVLFAMVTRPCGPSGV